MAARKENAQIMRDAKHLCNCLAISLYVYMLIWSYFAYTMMPPSLAFNYTRPINQTDDGAVYIVSNAGAYFVLVLGWGWWAKLSCPRKRDVV